MTWRVSRLMMGVLVALASLLAVASLQSRITSAATGINKQINFQGKLTNPNGTNVTDGNYSILFTIYQGGTDTGGGANLWSETQTVSVANGIFRVSLGSVNTTLGTAVSFNDDTLYLSLKVGSDPEMSPYIRFTAAPYAFNAGALGGIAPNGFAQLSPSSQQTGNINISGTVTAAGTGTSSFGGPLQSASYLLGSGPDLSLQPVVGGQSALTSWWGLQLVGNKQSTVQYTPSNIGNPGDYGVIIPAQQAGAIAVLIRAANSQSGDLLRATDNSGATTLAKIDSTGGITSNGASAFNASVTVTTGTSNSLTVTSGSNVPTADMVNITNSGQGVTTSDVNGLAINYYGGNAAVEAAGERINLTPGATSGSTWNGLQIVASTMSASGVAQNGIKLSGPGTGGLGTEVGVTIDANWDAGLQLGAKTSDPNTPPTDNIYVYARKMAGRSLLRQRGPSGVSFAYQPALFEQAISMVTPTATAEGISSTLSNTWAVNAPGTGATPTSTEAQGYTANYPTASSTGSVSTIGQTIAQWYRGSTGGSNGFFYVSRLLFPDANYGTGATGARTWTGLTSAAIGNTMTNTDSPSANYAGFQYSTTRADSTNWQFLTNNAGTVNVISTNMPFTVANLYDFYIFTPPQGSTIYWRIDNLTNGTTQEGSTSTSLPTATTAMRGEVALQTLSATSRNVRMAKIYIESDR